MPARKTAHTHAVRWNDQWWDYVKNGTPLPLEKRAALKQKPAAPPPPALQFIIIKSSRYVDEAALTPADAYAGKTCERAGVEPGKVYDSFEAAQADAKVLSKRNPVGFDVLPLPTL